MTPRLFYNTTIYGRTPIQDINPLVLQKYCKGQILILCAREGSVKRIAKMVNDPLYPYDDQVLLAYGWWEADKMGLITKGYELDKANLNAQDAIIILNQHRVDPLFSSLVKRVEKFCSRSYLPHAS